MKYKNKVTGAVLESAAAINGIDWEEIPIFPQKKKIAPTTEKATEDAPKKKPRRKKVIK